MRATTAWSVARLDLSSLLMTAWEDTCCFPLGPAWPEFATRAGPEQSGSWRRSRNFHDNFTLCSTELSRPTVVGGPNLSRVVDLGIDPLQREYRYEHALLAPLRDSAPFWSVADAFRRRPRTGRGSDRPGGVPAERQWRVGCGLRDNLRKGCDRRQQDLPQGPHRR